MTSTSFTRRLGRSEIEVSALGMGCWAIGGPWTFNGAPAGWSSVDDAESRACAPARVRARRELLRHRRELRRRAQRAAPRRRVPGTASRRGDRHQVRLPRRRASGRGPCATATTTATATSPAGCRPMSRPACAGSAPTTSTSTSCTCGDLPSTAALDARAVLDELVERRQGAHLRLEHRSCRRGASVRGLATMRRRAAGLSVLDDVNPEMLDLCDELDLASINRGPLGMGLLTGKFTPASTFASDDQRRVAEWHPGFRDGRPTTEWLDKLAAIRDVLTSHGRTLGQGRSPGSGRAAPGRSRSRDSRPSSRSRRTAAPSPTVRSPPSRWPRSTASSAASRPPRRCEQISTEESGQK